MTAASDTPAVYADRVVAIVADLCRELHPGRERPVGLDRMLDAELGFDSLSRAELLLRVERAFAVALPEQLIAEAETPRDFLRALLNAAPAIRAEPGLATIVTEAALPEQDAPEHAETLLDALRWHVDRSPDRQHVVVYESAAAEPAILTYADLDAAARRVAAGLAATGLTPGAAVAIMLPTSVDYLVSFIAVLMTGAVPVPIYPPARASQLEDHLRRHAKILDSARAVRMITIPQARTAARLLGRHVASLTDIVTVAELGTDASGFEPHAAAPTDTAFVQFTSGSTGQPKGVVLSHANILANIRAMGQAVGASSDDVFVSWLPMYHDMGLIGAWLGSLYFAMRAVLMSPLVFLARPERWLWALHEHGGTLSAAPNFAYELCLAKVPDDAIEGLRLDRWRRAFNGAEPVSPRTVRRFCERFARYGFDAGAMAPVYGLAEAAVGLAFPPLDSGAVIDRVDRHGYEREGTARPAGPDAADALEFVACGRPLPGYEIRVVGAASREVGDREIGRLQFRGPSATSGYLRNPSATAALYDGDWLDSGDLAYIAGADVYLTSRVKDMIIRAGRNIYPYELEEAVGEIDGVRKGCVAVFGSDGGSTVEGEKLVVLAETRIEDRQQRNALVAAIAERSSAVLDMAPDDVVLAPPRTVLKTSSGKIRRSACRELYQTNALARPQRPSWWQVTRLVVSGYAAAWRRRRRAARDLLYGIYVQCVFLALAVPSWLAVAVVPDVRRRWRLLRAVARTFWRAARVPVVVEGGDRLPAGTTRVFVANHASYLDGIAAVAVLPARFSFAAKAELERRFVSRVFLRRIGARFVERSDTVRGLADAEAGVHAALGGESLFYFPEGGLTREPGLRAFHLGAFAAAARAGVAVVPITIRGTRTLLRGDSWLPRRGALTVVVGEPVYPQGDDFEAELALRDAARASILQRLGEPDLAE